jgi:hypothetical protein
MILIVPLYYVMPKHRALFCSLVAVIAAASLTRAVFLFLPVSVAIYWYFRDRGFGVTLGLAFLGVFGVLLFGDFIAAVSENSSTNGHVESIVDVLEFLNPLSLLTGALFGGKLPEFEPGLLNVLFMFGVGPFMLLILFLRGIYLHHARLNSPTPYIAILMLVAVLTLSVISGVFFATTSAWFAWFLAGFAGKRVIVFVSEPKQSTVPAPLQPAARWA